MTSRFSLPRKPKPAGLVLAAVLLALCVPAGAAPAAGLPPGAVIIPMKKDSGVYVVSVSVNGLATFESIVDSGASDVNIPASVFARLVRAGSVKPGDFIGTQDYTLADGSSETSRLYRIKSLKVGNVVVTNVVASVSGGDDSGLLGQSFLERFGSWSLDNTRHALVLVGPPSAGPPTVAAHAPGPDGGPPSVANAGPRPRDRGRDASDGDTVAQTGRHSDASAQDAPDPSDDGLTAQPSAPH